MVVHRQAAVILSTLFFNIYFWMGPAEGLWMFCPLPQYIAFLAVVTLLVTTIAVVGPAMAVFQSKRSVFELVGLSLGSVPAYAVRLGCIVLCVLWVAMLVSLPVRLWAFRTEPPMWQSLSAAAMLTAFLFWTGIQETRKSARLAFFTTKLGLALLIAALWRVRDGWPAIPAGFSALPNASQLWWGFSELVAYLMPFSLFAAGFARRIETRSDTHRVLAFGIAAPLFVSLLLSAVIAVATGKSSLYQPSLNPDVNMALFAHTASSAVQSRHLIAAVTLFGIARICVRWLWDTVPAPASGRKSLLLALIPLIAWLSMHPFADPFQHAFQFTTNCLGVVSAILTADLLCRHRPTPRRFNPVGIVAAILGIGLPWSVTLLPRYAIAFFATLLGRVILKS